MTKLAVIDFCGTIANFQTLDPYLEYVLKNERKVSYILLTNRVIKVVLSLFNRVIWKLGYHHYLKKALMVASLKGISEETLYEYGKKYYEERVKSNLISETIGLIEKLKSEGYMTLIVSGGSKYYIEYFADDFGIDDVISAEIEISDGKCTGRLLRECLGKEKVEMLKEYIAQKGINVSEKLCITDSESDIPILNECNKKIIISNNAHQKWIDDSMEEIIWE